MKKSLFLVLITVLISTGCMTVNVSSKQFIPRDRNKITLLKNVTPEYQLENLELIQADGSISRGVYFHKPGADFTVLYFLGSGIRVDADGGYFLKPFTELNANVIVFDYRGFGRSDSTGQAHDLKEIETDTLALYDYARKKVSGKLVVHGHSFGSFVAAKLANLRPVDSLVLEGTGTDAETYTKNLTPWFARPFVNIQLAGDIAQIDNRRSLKNTQFPVFIIASEHDTTTPEATARDLFESLNQTNKRFLKVNAGHMDAMTMPLTIAAYREFLKGQY
nr:alpha/beta fold hydrolase [uncultured Undibacterium sp.]